MNGFVEHRFLNPFSGKLPLLHKKVARFENSSESTPDDLIIKLPTPGEIGSQWQQIKELVASVLARGKERNGEWRKEVFACILESSVRRCTSVGPIVLYVHKVESLEQICLTKGLTHSLRVHAVFM